MLLAPQPPLSLLYLVALRAERIAPSFGPLLALAVFPLASLLIGVRAGGPRARRFLLGALAVAELAWTALAEAMVGFAIAWQSG